MRLFCFRLALALGCTVRELLSRLSSEELTEWMAYFELEPFGHPVDHHMSAQLADIIASAHGAKGTSAEAFMPKVSASQSVEEQQRMLARGVPGKKR